MSGPEAWLLPVAAVLVATVLPWMTARLLGWVYLTPTDHGTDPPVRARTVAAFHRAATFVEIAQIITAAAIGLHALGPTFVPAPFGPVSWTFAIVLAILAWLAGGVARRIAWLEPARPSVTAALGQRLRGRIRPGPPDAAPSGGRGAGVVLGLLLAGGIGGAPIALHEATDVTPADASSAPIERALWRLRVEPWDAEAMLALGWNARRSNHLDRAQRYAERAARMHPDLVARLELTTELRAARGDCDGATQAFQRALEERARREFEGVLEERLELGGYHLPPTYVTACRADAAP